MRLPHEYLPAALSGPLRRSWLCESLADLLATLTATLTVSCAIRLASYMLAILVILFLVPQAEMRILDGVDLRVDGALAERLQLSAWESTVRVCQYAQLRGMLDADTTYQLHVTASLMMLGLFFCSSSLELPAGRKPATCIGLAAVITSAH